LRSDASHVHVVVFHRLVSRIDVVADRRPDSGDLVGGNAGAYAGSTDQNAAQGKATADAVANGFGDIGKIDWIGVVGSTVIHEIPQLAKEVDDAPLQGETGVVAANG
jgi:hypothetical protein